MEQGFAWFAGHIIRNTVRLKCPERGGKTAEIINRLTCHTKLYAIYTTVIFPFRILYARGYTLTYHWPGGPEIRSIRGAVMTYFCFVFSTTEHIYGYTCSHFNIYYRYITVLYIIPGTVHNRITQMCMLLSTNIKNSTPHPAVRVCDLTIV